MQGERRDHRVIKLSFAPTISKKEKERAKGNQCSRHWVHGVNLPNLDIELHSERVSRSSFYVLRRLRVCHSFQRRYDTTGCWHNEETWRSRKVVSTKTSQIMEKDFGLELLRVVRVLAQTMQTDQGEREEPGMTDDGRRGGRRRKVRKFVEATPASARDKRGPREMVGPRPRLSCSSCGHCRSSLPLFNPPPSQLPFVLLILSSHFTAIAIARRWLPK